MFGIRRRGNRDSRRGAQPSRDRAWIGSGEIIDLGPLDDILSRSDRAVVDLPGHALQLLIVGRQDELFAFQPICPHLGRRLDDAVISSAGLTCRGHGLCFDLRTGAARRSLRGPAAGLSRPRLDTYPAWVEHGRLHVQVPRDA